MIGKCPDCGDVHEVPGPEERKKLETLVAYYADKVLSLCAMFWAHCYAQNVTPSLHDFSRMLAMARANVAAYHLDKFDKDEIEALMVDWGHWIADGADWRPETSPAPEAFEDAIREWQERGEKLYADYCKRRPAHRPTYGLH